MEQEKKLSLEEHFESLEKIIRGMEDPEATLDGSFELYKKGLDHIRAANTMLDDMEKEMLIIRGDGSLDKF